MICVFVGMIALSSPALIYAQGNPCSLADPCSTADTLNNSTCSEPGDDVPDVCPVGSTVHIGDGSDETINGSGVVDCIFGLGGDDTLKGKGGNDYICGGEGADTIRGDDGDDELFGEGGDDDIKGNDGEDVIFGGDGADKVNGDGGDDTIDGGAGDDDLKGGTQDDTILGGDGADTIKGGKGNDTVEGGAGDDDINGEAGNDILLGGADNDTIDGGGGADNIAGEDGNDDLKGGSGDDNISGGDGSDTIDGNGGTNVCVDEEVGHAGCDTLTWVGIREFELVEEPSGRRVLHWVTDFEDGVAGFRVSRWDAQSEAWIALHQGWLASEQGSQRGADYWHVDHGAVASTQTSPQYLLEERTQRASIIRHGPFEVSVRKARSALAPGQEFLRTKHAKALRLITRASRAVMASAISSEQPDGMWLFVAESGLHQVSATEIAETLMLEEANVRAAILSHGIQLTQAGAPVAWEVVDAGSALSFFGEWHDDSFSAYRVFGLELGSGVQMSSETASPVTQGDVAEYVASLRLEEDIFAATLVIDDPRRDLFFWRALSSNDEMLNSFETNVFASNRAEGIDAELVVALYGATDKEEEEEADQRIPVEIRFNGQLLGTAQIEGISSHVEAFALPASALMEGNNTLRFDILGDSENLNIAYLDTVELRYTRSALALDDRLMLEGASGEVTLGGFSSDEIEVLDITDPHQPIRYSGHSVHGASAPYATSFVADPAKRYWVQTDLHTAVETRAPLYAAGLIGASQGAEYVVITPRIWRDQAEILIAERSTQGLSTRIVHVEDIFGEFADGVRDPLAIKVFLTHAWSVWDTPPRFVVLLGRGTFDYRDVYGLRGNDIPPLLVATRDGLHTADALFGDVDDDQVPEIAIGRVPISDASSFDTWFSNMRNREATLGASSTLLLSDHQQEDANFSESMRVLMPMLPEGTLHTHIDLDTTSVEEARTRFFSDWGQDWAWASYMGHGGIDRLSKSTWITKTDLEELSSAQTQGTIFTGWTCLVGRYEIPGFEPFASSWLMSDDGGLSAFIAPSGPSDHREATLFSDAFYDAALQAKVRRLGDALLFAHQEISVSNEAELHVLYTLFGDPALEINSQVSSNQSSCTLSTRASGQESFYSLLLILAALSLFSRRKR